MFETSSHPEVAFRRRASRLAFGGVLVLGAILIVDHVVGRAHGLFVTETHDTVWWFAGTWAAAFAAAIVVRVAARFVRPSDDDGHLLRASLVAQAVGLALVLPLTIHLAWMYLVSHDPAGFDDWVQLSVLAVGAAHVVFAILAGVRADQLARGRKAVSVPAVYGYSVFAAAFPLLVPVIYVAITGIPIVPLLYYMPRIAERERATTALPIATVVR